MLIIFVKTCVLQSLTDIFLRLQLKTSLLVTWLETIYLGICNLWLQIFQYLLSEIKDMRQSIPWILESTRLFSFA